MQEVQLYIQGQRIDLFKDETISLTQSIQNVKDPGKIFTEFSKTFTIPANKENNKIFKHYYNYNILNGYDARLKVSGEIKLNYLTFKKGFIKLEGVDLKDNKPNLYRITFFGETVSLKDLIGEDKLSALNWLDNFYVSYDSTNIKAYLQNAYDKTVSGTLYTDAILTPLISHTSRWYFDTSTGHENLPNAENNLHYDTGTGHDHGALWSDMKYSIRVHLIIKAIEQKYNIEFSTDFFNTGNTDYYGLYMWMHRKKGDVQGQVTGPVVYSTLVDTWIDSGDPYPLGYPKVYTDGITVNVRLLPPIVNIESQLTIDPVDDAINYNIKIYKNGSIWNEYNNVSGNQTKTFTHLDSFADYTIYLESSEALFFNPIEWSFDFYDGSGTVYNDTITASGINIGASFDFYPTQQIPDIKILDFLTGLFKMFNLTSYVDNGVIVVNSLDNFYQTYNTYDITKYVDTSKSSVNVALPYKQIDFNFKDYKTFLATVFNQLNNKQFGELKYNGGDESNNWVGGIYKVELPFQKIMYERLIDLDDNSDTTIQWGYFVDDNQDSYYGLPLLHYVKRQTGGTNLSFRDGIGHSSVSTYYIPLNSNGITGSEQSLHFGSETDEYSKVFNNNSLFENYYKNYITDIFNSKSRVIKTKAFLPLKILLKFNLSDRFIISGKSYKINSIETNLQTGESSMELLNDL